MQLKNTPFLNDLYVKAGSIEKKLSSCFVLQIPEVPSLHLFSRDEAFQMDEGKSFLH